MTFLRLFFLCFLLFPTLTPAEESAPPATVEKRTFPSVAEIIPKASQISENAMKAEAEMAPLADLTKITTEMEGIKSRQAEIMKRVTALGEVEQWTFDRLLEMRGTVGNHMTELRKLVDTLSQRLTQLETLRQQWKTEEDFWKNWRAELKGTTEEIPVTAFTKSIAQAQKVGERAKEISAPLVEVQKEISSLQTEMLDVQNKIERTLNTLRKQTFKKTTHSVISKGCYLQVTPELIRRDARLL